MLDYQILRSNALLITLLDRKDLNKPLTFLDLLEHRALEFFNVKESKKN